MQTINANSKEEIQCMNKGNFKHINAEQRRVIVRMISDNKKLKDIASTLGLDPTSISKEVKRNRIRLYPVHNPKLDLKLCTKLDRFPYVCNSCKYRYDPCPFEKYVYKAKEAQAKADYKLIVSRRGLDSDDKEFKQLDETVKAGVENGKSIYEISLDPKVSKSVTTIYRYINKGYLKISRMDLPYAVTYKKRKKINKKYDYKQNNGIDRSNHTYVDYLSYIHANPREFGWQLDFLGSIKSDSKSIISLIMPDLHFSLIDIISNPSADKVVKYFDRLEENLGTEQFKKIFPFILTDRDPCFADVEGICFSKITGEERTRLFFCDPYVSNQKPHIENLNKQLRLHFPKGRSIDHLSKADVKNINIRILKQPLKSLDGSSSKEAFSAVFGKDNFTNIIK